MSMVSAVRARLRLLFSRRNAEDRMSEEIRFHLEMETERLVREEGLDPEAARRRALLAFGGVEKVKEELRDGRGLGWLSGLSLDLKLGFRMLVKYPVLTGASVLALAVAVALAASWFEFSTDMARPRIPLEDADRIVQLRNRDLATTDRDYSSEPRSLHDFETWRDEVETIDDLAAASTVEYSVTTDDDRLAMLKGARVTPSIFRLARVQPLLGRALTAEDDRPDAPLVAVLGYAAWQRLFDGERSAVGRTVRLGSDYATVVGVMPPGFAFPLNHEIWTPLRESALSYERRRGPALAMYGRLAAGATLDEARAELEVIGRRTAAAFPETHENLLPEVRRFARGNWEAVAVTALNLPFLLFLVVVAANVATLLFARTATRESEIALRSALGARRRRIILQLVVEALVLTMAAAALGLAGAGWGLGRAMDLFFEVQQMRPPFWWDSGLSTSTAVYVCALAILGAAIVGGIPGFRATRRRLRERLPQPGAGSSGLRFGSVATGVIVAQVALCVAFLPVAIMAGQELLPDRGDTHFPAESFLSGRLTRPLDPNRPEANAQDGAPGEARRATDLFDEVLRRAAAEPGVLEATRASRLPGFNHPVAAIELDDDSATIVRARSIAVDPNFFEVMSARVISGRPFEASDVSGTGDVAIVDQAWATEVFGGRNPIGRRIRYPSREDGQPGPWHEIVGVVAGMDRAIGPGETVGVYHPLRPERHASLQIYLRTAGAPTALASQVHGLVTAMDPGLGLADLRPLEETWRPVERSNAFFAAALSVVSLIILLFALIGIYALMSFTVTQRAREIGIRAALGANPQRIILAIFSRAMAQIGLGIVAGATLVSLTVAHSPEGFRLVAGVAAAMVAVGMAGCVVPAARALRVQPIEALRVE